MRESKENMRNETIVPSNLTLAGSEFQRVDAATAKAQIPAFVFNAEWT